MSETPESPFTPDSTTSCGMRRTCLKHELGIVEIGTFASLLITFLLWLWKLPGEAQALMIQQYAALLAALCYTFCGLWVIEARYLGELDKLHFWWQRHLEKFLRFSIVTFLPFAASSLDSEHSLLLFGASTLLLAIYLAFLAWDAVVYFGGRKEVVKEFWVFDVLCVGLALICWTATSPL